MCKTGSVYAACEYRGKACEPQNPRVVSGIRDLIRAWAEQDALSGVYYPQDSKLIKSTVQIHHDCEFAR